MWDERTQKHNNTPDPSLMFIILMKECIINIWHSNSESNIHKTKTAFSVLKE